MKINWYQFFITLATIIIGIWLIFYISACSDSKQAVRHYTKFIEKGGKIAPKSVTDTVEVLIKGANGKDSLIYVPVDVDCPDVVIPESNSQTRQKNKTIRTQIKVDGKVAKVKERKKPKVNRSANRLKKKLARINKQMERIKSNAWNFWDKLFFGISLFVLGYLTHLVVKRLI